VNGRGDLAGAQRGMGMGDIRSKTDHVKVQAAEKFDIVGQGGEGLAGDAHHDAAADFIAELTKAGKDFQPMGGSSRAGRVDKRIEGGVGCFESEEVAVCAGLPPAPEVFKGAFAQTERDGQRGGLFDGADDLGEPFRLDSIIFSRLEDDGAIAEVGDLADTFENLVGGHAITPEVFVVSGESAVGAGSHAVIGDFEQPAQVDCITDVFFSDSVGHPPESFEGVGVCLLKPGFNFCSTEHDWADGGLGLRSRALRLFDRVRGFRGRVRGHVREVRDCGR